MKSDGVVKADVKQLLVIHKPDSHPIEEADATNNVYWEILGLSEIDDGFPLEIADGDRDFMSVSDERAGSVRILCLTPASSSRPSNKA